MREINSVILQICSASSDAERKQILEAVSMTAEGFRELYGPITGLPVSSSTDLPDQSSSLLHYTSSQVKPILDASHPPSPTFRVIPHIAGVVKKKCPLTRLRSFPLSSNSPLAYCRPTK
ncbi:hypothetical protein ACGFWD_15545 [Streptomyces sp. NPDC048448]|uniref:hypothetical protein n=1 Tax=Streptomyces sp. NPDC048448 TaxID=3365554 RepID=UPI003722BD4D